MITRRIRLLALFALSLFAAELPATLQHCAPATAQLAPIVDLRADIRAGNQAVKKVSVVVPVYREWSNGNLLSFLENFAGQTAATNQFELVLVVNNTPEVKAAGEPAYLDNRRSLEALNYLAHPEAASTFSYLETSRLGALRAKRMNIRVLDQSAGVERNMGKIRDSGLRDVLARLGGRPEDCLVATLDADTLVPPDYLENAIVHFSLPRNAGLGVLYMPIALRLEAGADRRMFHDTHLVRQRFAEFQLIEAVRGEHNFGGPQLIATAKALAEVGGVPHKPMAENVALMKLLNAKFPTLSASDMRVVTADRARADGFFGAQRQTDLNRGQTRYAGMMMGEERIVHELARTALLEAEASWGPHFDEAKAIALLASFGLELKPDLWAEAKKNTRSFIIGPANFVRAWRSVGTNYFRPLRKGTTSLVTLFRSKLTDAERVRFDHLLSEAMQRDTDAAISLQEALVHRIGQQRRGEPPVAGRTLEFFEGNRWVDDQIVTWISAGKTQAEIMESLKQELPEWLGVGQEAPARATTLRLDVIAHMLRDGRARPDESPGMTQFTGLFRTGYR